MELFNRLKIFLILLALILAVGLFVRLTRKPKVQQPSGLGFRDVIKDPDGAGAQFEELGRQREADGAPLDEAGMQAAADRLLNGDNNYRYVIQLEAQGKRAVPILLKCLADPRYLRSSSKGGFVPFQIPVTGIMHALGALEEPKAVPLVAALTKNPSIEIRAGAIICLCEIGTAECIEPVKQALNGSDNELLSRVSSAFNTILEREKNPKPINEALFEPLLALVNRAEKETYMEAASSLLRIDPKRAVGILAAADYVTTDNQNIAGLLIAFNRSEAVLPAKLVLDMIPELKKRCESDPGRGGAYGECLIALANAKYPESESIINDGLKLKSWRARRAAAEALCIIKGVRDPVKTAYTLMEKQGAGNVRPAVRQYAAVRTLIDEVSNGGLDQYFFNSSGDESAAAQEGLSKMGLDNAANVFRQACAMFGLNGPAANRRQRQQQLKKISETTEGAFSKLDDAFYKCEEELEVKTLLFVANNSADFKEAGSK